MSEMKLTIGPVCRMKKRKLARMLGELMANFLSANDFDLIEVTGIYMPPGCMDLEYLERHPEWDACKE